MMGRLLLLVALLLPSLVCSSSAAQEYYLKEILLGRCYFAPPSSSINSADHCPTIVGSIMNVLESHLDADIGADDFGSYLSESDFTSPPNKALVVLHFFGGTKSPTTSFPNGYYVTPETTPGGSLLANLIFCGVDQHGNCSIEKSNAYWKFWEAAYAKFASQVQGHVTIIVEPLADLEFLQRTIIAKLHTNTAVSSVTMYTTHKEDCHKMLEGIDNVTCKSDITEFYLDAFNITSSTSNNEDCSTTNATTSESAKQEDTHTTTTTTTGADFSKDITHEYSNRARRSSVILFLLLLALVYGVYHYIYADTLLTDNNNNNNNKSSSPRITHIIVDAWHHVRERIGTLWQQFLWMMSAATTPNHNEDDEESSSIMTTTEQSPLLGVVNESDHHNFIIDEFGCRIPARRAVAQ